MNSYASSSNVKKFEIDKGNVSITVVARPMRPTVTTVKNADCDVTASVKNIGNTIKVSHSTSSHCQRGNDILITIGTDKDVEVNLKAGTVTLKDAGTALQKFSELDANVSAGAIVTQNSNVEVNRTNNSAGSSAVYKNNPKTSVNKPALKLSVRAGNISL